MSKANFLVSSGRIYSSEYHGILASHLPMALYALSGLGASDQRLTDYYNFYRERLEKRHAPERTIDFTNWTQYLGLHSFHADYLAFFNSELSQLGVNKLLNKYLPKLLESTGSGAFHGIIRTAYGIDFEDPDEIAEGLAYWCLSYLPMPSVRHEESLKSGGMNETLVAALNDPELTAPSGKNIIERLEKVLKNPRLVHYLTATDISLETLARLTAQWYLNTRNFTLLHAMTGTHALRLILPHVVDRKRALKSHWHSVLASALTVTEIQNAELPKHETAADWPAIQDAAIQSNDDHVIKLVYTCLKEESHYGGDLYKLIAASKAGV